MECFVAYFIRISEESQETQKNVFLITRVRSADFNTKYRTMYA